MNTIYLDNAATTAITQPVLEAMMPYLTTEYGNPSALYSLGRKTKQAIETAREQCAKAINAETNEIFFTSGATESNNIIARGFKHICAEITEHHSISKQPNLVKNTSRNDTVVSKIAVNNETGDISHLPTYKMLAYATGNKFHTDATQAFGHIPIDVKEIGCDYLSLSGHKFHAPKGAGILYVKNGDTSRLVGQIGGQQEQGFRAGTENVTSIVGMGKAMELYNYCEKKNKEQRELKHYIVKTLRENNIDFRVNSFNIDIDKVVPNILNMSFRGVEGESLLLMLNTKGICVSSGSACNSGTIGKSDVIEALSVPDEYAFGTIRVSMSEFTTYDEIKYFTDTLIDIIHRIRKV